MISEAKAFWDPISGKVKDQIQREMGNALQVQRYDVTTAPDGSVMGVTQPFGSNEIFLPYSKEVAGATVGDTVLVAWWGSMSNARVYYFAKGYEGTSVNGQTGAVTVPTPTYNQTTITSGTHDLNSYTTPGLYYFSSGATLTNVPNSAVNGWLWVLKPTNSSAKQIWTRQGSNPTTTKDFFMRFLSGGTWGNWFGWMNRWELLWTNASPTSSFAAQTVSLSLSGYDAIILMAQDIDTEPESYYIPKTYGSTYIYGHRDFENSNTIPLTYRHISVSNTGIVFSSGQYKLLSGSNSPTVRNDFRVPTAIYGIKGVG